MNHCKHFSYHEKTKCKLGIVAREVTGGPTFGWLKRSPCVGFDIGLCPKYEALTDKEIEESKAALEAMVERMQVILPVLTPLKTEENLGRAGSIECPICDGTIEWQLHNNNHMWAKCSTDECFNMME